MAGAGAALPIAPAGQAEPAARAQPLAAPAVGAPELTAPSELRAGGACWAIFVKRPWPLDERPFCWAVQISSMVGHSL